MKKLFAGKPVLAAEIILTICICITIISDSLNDTKKHSYNFSKDVISSYEEITSRYVSVFKAIAIQVKDEIKKDPSFDEMNEWLQSKNDIFSDAVGNDVFDGFAITYKNGYAHSWDYGEYSDYDPNTRPWYQKAKKANGEVTVVAPYVTYLDPSYLNNDQYIEMTIAQKYNDEIYFDMDLKIKKIKDILLNKGTQYKNTLAVLVDSQGYVLSTNKEGIYSHNINTPDGFVDSQLCSCIKEASKNTGEINLCRNEKQLCLSYALKSDNGNAICLIVPFINIFAGRFFLITLITLFLILTEIFIYIHNRRKMKKLTERDKKITEIANAAFEEHYNVDISSLNNIKKRAAYEKIYNIYYDEIVGESAKKEFEKYYCANALIKSNNSNVITKIFSTEWENSDGTKTPHDLKFTLIISGNKIGKTATLLVNDITKEQKRKMTVMQAICFHNCVVLVGNTAKKSFDVIKAEDEWESLIQPQKETFERLSRIISEEHRKDFFNITDFDFIISKLKKAEEFSTAVELENGHWYVMKIIRGSMYNESKDFVFCIENADEQMKSQNQLREALNQAKSATQAKSEFLSRMSHEIRTPMNAIVGITEIAKNHADNPVATIKYLNKIDSSSKLLLGVLNDVLDMSAIENEKLKIARNEFDLKQIINNLNSLYLVQCQNKGIRFSVFTDITNEAVIGDSLRVNQVLINLISNAYKFTESGGEISVTVFQTEKTDKDVFIRFIIKDTGCGISDDMLGRLFKPFEQESVYTARKTGGSGLGLSIAANLVEMMHGSISVKSKKGEGSEFIVDLPFGITGHSNIMDAKKLKFMKVLIVDDDKTSLLYTAVVMEKIGLIHEEAYNALSAIKMAEKQHKTGNDYNICFIDWKMPDITGIELTKKIKNICSNTAVIIISAFDLSEIEDEARKNGADLFIQKPLFQSTVFNAIEQITGGIANKTTKVTDKYDFSGHKLLLAEDNEMNKDVATEILNMVNMSVDWAENGKKAIEKFESSAPKTYDLILMDVQMPEIDGYEATKVIRESSHPEAKTIPIFAMTANAFSDDIAKSISSGMNGHITKPIDTNKLYETISECLDNI